MNMFPSSNYIPLGKSYELSKLLYFYIHTYTPSLEVPFQVECAFYYTLIIRDEIMHSERLNWLGYI